MGRPECPATRRAAKTLGRAPNAEITPGRAPRNGEPPPRATPTQTDQQGHGRPPNKWCTPYKTSNIDVHQTSPPSETDSSGPPNPGSNGSPGCQGSLIFPDCQPARISWQPAQILSGSFLGACSKFPDTFLRFCCKSHTFSAWAVECCVV